MFESRCFLLVLWSTRNDDPFQIGAVSSNLPNELCLGRSFSFFLPVKIILSHESTQWKRKHIVFSLSHCFFSRQKCHKSKSSSSRMQGPWVSETQKKAFLKLCCLHGEKTTFPYAKQWHVSWFMSTDISFRLFVISACFAFTTRLPCGSSIPHNSHIQLSYTRLFFSPRCRSDEKDNTYSMTIGDDFLIDASEYGNEFRMLSDIAFLLAR